MLVRPPHGVAHAWPCGAGRRLCCIVVARVAACLRTRGAAARRSRHGNIVGRHGGAAALGGAPMAMVLSCLGRGLVGWRQCEVCGGYGKGRHIGSSAH